MWPYLVFEQRSEQANIESAGHFGSFQHLSMAGLGMRFPRLVLCRLSVSFASSDFELRIHAQLFYRWVWGIFARRMQTLVNIRVTNVDPAAAGRCTSYIPPD